MDSKELTKMTTIDSKIIKDLLTTDNNTRTKTPKTTITASRENIMRAIS